jgi:hypothetical protein
MPSSERECGCPSWVLRCVHFEGQILVLGADDADPTLWGHTCAGGMSEFDREGYAIHQGPNFTPCIRGDDCPAVTIACEGKVCSWFYGDLDAANDAFGASAAALLGRAE